MQPGGQVPPHYYRLKAVDDTKSLGNQVSNFQFLFFKSKFDLYTKIFRIKSFISFINVRDK